MFTPTKVVIFSLLCCYFVKADDETLPVDEEQVIKYSRPSDEGLAYFAEPFHSSEEFESKWKYSEAKKDGVEESIAKYDGKWAVGEPKDNPILGDSGLIYSSEAKHGAISAPLQIPFKFEDKPLIVQYEVRFQKKHECGGAYVKLLADSPDLKLSEFGDKTEYTIMFGPDKCGGDGKLHFIFQHKNPITHKMEEKHAKKPTEDFNTIFDDGKTHLVGLIVRPDNTYEVQVDKAVVSSGSLLKDMEPPINPAKQIDDPEDLKPEDWDEREKITDPVAVKPEDWDEDAPKMITDPNAVKPAGWLDDEPELAPDPAAVKPQDWDEEEDGEWEAPQIPNPNCKAIGCGEWKAQSIKNPAFKGKWTAPLIDNVAYKGVWKAKQIENPNYFEDQNPFTMKPIAAVGFELWSMQSDILFDNIIIANDMGVVTQWTLQTWDLKHTKEVKNDPNGSIWKSFMETTKEKPWLWVVVVLVALLPIIMIYFLCCTGSKEDRAASYKKTDETLPDDEVDESETNDEVNGENTPEDDTHEEVEKKSGGEEESTPNIEEVTDNVVENADEKKVPVEVEKIAEEKDLPASEEVKEVKDLPKDDSESPNVAPIENIPSSEESNKAPQPLDEEEPDKLKELSAEESITEKIRKDDVEEETNIVEVPHASPRTRAAKKKIRKDS